MREINFRTSIAFFDATICILIDDALIIIIRSSTNEFRKNKHILNIRGSHQCRLYGRLIYIILILSIK